MLVRAKRLVWSSYGIGFVSSWSANELYVSSDGDWIWTLEDGARCNSGKCETVELAKEHCQIICDEMWMDETEVMPLEWNDIDSEGRYCFAETVIGEYYVDQTSDGFVWYFVYGEDEFDGRTPCDSRDHGKQLCEAHHRKLVLGE